MAIVGKNAKLSTNDSKSKKTSQGNSKNTRFVSKNDHRLKKHYRGQGK